MNNNRKVLVTGADGFIGSHLSEELVRRGYNVRSFVFYNSFNSWGWLDYTSKNILENIEIFQGDIRDPHGVKMAMKGCDTVFHLAALIAIPYSYHSPASYVDTNITGTLNILQAGRELDTHKIVHTSTSEVYGSAKFVPITEEHPLQAQSPYSATKIGADQLALSFNKSFDTPVSVIRPFNTYGPRQSARAVIPTVISQIASGKTKINLGALSPTRDFSYVKDTVNGFIAIGKSEKAVGQTINLGTGYEISIKDLAALIGRIMGKKINIALDRQRIRPEKSEVDRLCSDNSKARETAGWTPEFSGKKGLENGLKETIDWFTNKQNLALYKSEIYNV